MPTAMTLPGPLQRRLESGLVRLLWPGGRGNDDFLQPHGEPALIAADSVSWQVFSNPLSVFIGGVAAVVLELAEPRVRTGVWDNTSFRERPLTRLQRTGYAAMMSVYGPCSRVLPMIAGVRRIHASLHGITPDGRAFHASDPELLEWVHATASFGFIEAYHRYVRPLPDSQRDRFYAEAAPVAALYGCVSAPATQLALDALFDGMANRLEPSDVVLDFLSIAASMPALPRALRPVQGLLVKAALDIVPLELRRRIGLGAAPGLQPWHHATLRGLGAAVERMKLETSPSLQACRRLGLPDDHLLARR